MKLLQSLLSWHQPTLPVAFDDAAVDELPPFDEQQPGCGWFESSHDLRCGLQVREHAANEAACAELPLTMWLALQQA